MRNVFLPMGKRAHLPYTIEPAGIEVYTIEELCHGVVREAELLEKSFMSEKLVDFVRRQLGLSDLAGELSDVIASGGSLTDFCSILLCGTDYLRGSSLDDLLDRIERSENTSPLLKTQKKLEMLLRGREYFSLLSQCEMILSGLEKGFEDEDGKNAEEDREHAELRAAVLMKQAAAYAALFYYQPAANAYLAAHLAYEKADLTVYSKKARGFYLMCLILMWDEEEFDNYLKDHPGDKELAIVVKNRISRAAEDIKRAGRKEKNDPLLCDSLRYEYELM